MARIARIIWKGSHRGHYPERREAWLELKPKIIPQQGAGYAQTFWSRVWELKQTKGDDHERRMRP